ncbi:MAG: outer membrane beta-barrel protein [candidate division WOR-3 bacterium]|nr:outer membrane beta-barrel protein [candidate division WOR-3 bacterium]
MKKLLPLFLIFALSTVFAVDMSGKLGMGIGWTVGSSGIPDAAITKFALGEKLVLEPALLFSFTSMSNDESESNYEFNLNLLLAYALMAHEKTNFYAKAGISFGMEKEPKMTSFGIPLGLGLEYFVSDHFAVDLNHVMGFNYTMYDYDEIEQKTMRFNITTHQLTAGLVWYY